MRVVTKLRMMALSAGLVLLGVLGGSLWAASDMDFVSGLVDRGYYDLALEWLDRMDKSPDLPKGDRVLLPLVRGQIYVNLSRITADPVERNALLVKASESFTKFAEANPDHPRILDVTLDQARILSERANAAADSYRQETNAEKKAKLLTEAEGLFKQAIEQTGKVNTLLDQRLDEVQKKRPITKEVRDELMAVVMMRVKALFQTGDMQYLYASLYQGNAAKRAAQLEEALKAYDVVATERPTTNYTFLAYVREGMCHGELAPLEKDSKKGEARIAKAMESFEAALKCERKPETAAIRLEALHQKAKLAFSGKDYEVAIGAADSYLREAGERINDLDGQRLLLLRAQAQAQQAFDLKTKKDETWQSYFDEAVNSLQMVGPQYPALRAEADAFMQSWLSKAGSEVATKVTESVFVLINRARKLLEEKKYDQTIEAYQQVAAKATSAQDRKYAGEAWLNIGAVYYKQKSYYEATLAWQKLIREYPDVSEQAADLGYYNSQLFAALYQQGKDGFDLDHYLSALEDFTSSFPKDPRFFEATTRLAEVLGVKGEYARAAVTWGRADADNPRYAEAMFKSGQLYWKAYLKLAESGKKDAPEAQDVLNKAQEVLTRCTTATSADAKTDAKWPAQGLMQLAEILADRVLPQPDCATKAIPVLEDLKAKYPEYEPAKQLLYRVTALCLMKRPQEAEPFGVELADKYVGKPEFQLASQELVVAFQNAGNKAKSTEWQKRMVVNIDTASDEQLWQLGQGFWAQEQYAEASSFFSKLETRLQGKTDADARKRYEEVRESLAAVYFQAREYAKALPYYHAFYAKDPGNMVYFTRLAWSQEEAGDPGEALKNWRKIQADLLTAEPDTLFFEARLHMARCLKKLKQFRDGVELLQQTKVLYGGFGPDKKVNDEAERLLKEMTGG